MTVDEADHWFPRADQFLRALQHHNYAGTNLVGHPGVTTMWLGAAGVLVQHALAGRAATIVGSADLHRILLRLPVAIVTSLCLALAFSLLSRLLDRRVALLAALLWAADPFLVAHSQLLHTDALLTSFMTLALLAAMLAFRLDEGAERHSRPVRWEMLVASAVAGGLALLTKSPSITLLPMIGLFGLAYGHGAQRHARRVPVLPLVAWGCIAAGVWFALWPAAWVNLPGVLRSMYYQARNDGGSPHAYGNFLFGRAVADPGPLFYPVAILFRTTPWTMLGLVAAIAVLPWQRSMAGRRALALLAVFTLVFIAVLSVGAKKFDRYALPIFPSLEIIAAAGLFAVAQVLRRRLTAHRMLRAAPVVATSAGLLVVLGLAANVAWYHPYELAYYNPLLGGGRVAARTIPIGWGEGYEQAGAFLSARYDGCDRPIAAWFGEVLIPYVCDPVVPLDQAAKPGHAHYAVLYVDQLQRNDVPQVTAMLLHKQQPIYTVRIHGIDYVYVYELPPPVTHRSDATFGADIRFQGYAVDTAGVRASGILTATLAWEATATAAEKYALFVHVLDAHGQRVGQIDLPLAGPQARARGWQPGRTVYWNQRIPVRPDAAPGPYWLAVGLYSPADFKRLPLHAAAQPAAPDDGPDALRVGPFSLP